MLKNILSIAGLCLIQVSAIAQISGFEMNKGQVANQKGEVQNDVLFRTRQGNAKVYFYKDHVSYYFYKKSINSTLPADISNLSIKEIETIKGKDTTWVYRLDLDIVGAQTAKVEGHEIQRAHANFYLAHCPEGIQNVPFYKSLVYENVYPGVNFKFSFTAEGLKYDIHAEKGADLGLIKLRYNGADKVDLINNKLILNSPFGEMNEELPASYNLIDNVDPFENNASALGDEISVKYALGEDDIITFSNINNSDHGVLIDPRLVWSTYYNYDDDEPYGQELHAAAGEVVSVSSTEDGLMPTLDPGGLSYYQGSLDTSGILRTDLRILKFTTEGVLNWATYYGGTETEIVRGGVKINPNNGDIFIAAQSTSTNFPTQDIGGGAWFENTNPTGEQQIVLLRFDQTGIRQWGTYFNSSFSANVYDLDLSSTGKLYIVGDNAVGYVLPTQTWLSAYNQAAPDPNDPNGTDAFIAGFDANGVFEWGSYFGAGIAGAQDINESFRKVKLTPDGSIYAVGIADNNSAITLDAGGFFDGTHNGNNDVLAVRFSNVGALEWSTYFGGTGDEKDVYGIAADSANSLYISGVTLSSDYPVQDPGSGAFFDNTLNGTQSGFIAKFNSNVGLAWSTYFGAAGNDWNTTLDVSPNGKVYVAEYTQGSSGMPTMNKTNAFFETTGTGPTFNGFVAQFDTSGVQEWGTYVSSLGNTVYQTIRTYDGLCGDQVYVGGFQSDTLYPVVDPGSGAYVQSYSGFGLDKFTLSQFNDNLQDPGWTPPTTLCSGSPSINLNTTVTGTPGGVWSGPGVLAGVFDPSSVSNDTVNVTYTLGSGSCIDSLQQEIVINLESVIPLSINGTNDSICPGGSSTLSINGGSLGGGADWFWYQGSCGNNFLGNGTSIVVSPGSTTTYYARAEGTCNITGCVAFTVTIKTLSTPAASITANMDPVCVGDSTYLLPNGGSLGTGADWTWYEGSCGGTLLGTGDSIAVYPTVSTDYYVSANGDCNTTVCQMVTVGTANPSTDPTGISAIDTVICQGSFTTLSIVGGSLGTSANWEWYSGTCGGTPEGSGTSIIVSPTSSTTYFARSEGYCGDGICVQLTIDVNTNSVDPVSVSASKNPICSGDSTILTVNGGSLGSGADWYWYSGSCGGTPVDTGAVITVFPVSTPITYFVRAENLCNQTNCQTVTINITPAGDASWVSPGTICESTGIINLDQFVTGNLGGTWSGTNVAGATFNPAGLSGSSVTLTYVEGSAPCQDTLSFVVAIATNVNASWTNPGNVCEGNGPVDLDALITGSTGGSWSGTGVTGSSFDPSGLNGPINIEYMVGVAPSCIDSSELQVTVIQGPSTPVITVSDTSICEGDTSTIFVAGAGGPVDFHVYDAPSGGVLMGDANLTVMPSITTTYYVQAEDGNGCFHSSVLEPVTITVTPAPLADAGVNVEICEGGTANLTATGGTDYLWSTTETTASISVSPTDDQIYYVTVTDNVSMCSAVDSVIVAVITQSDLTADDDNYTTMVNVATTLDIMSNDVNGDPNSINIIYGPNGGNAIISGNEIIYTSNQDFVGFDSIIYTICHPVCMSVCDTALVKVFVTSSLEAVPPTGFSPNADGINDQFVVIGLENYPEAELIVFNRWGEQVYYAQPYNNNWGGESNGNRTLSGEVVQDGTYFYILRLGDSFDTINGHVEVKRQ